MEECLEKDHGTSNASLSTESACLLEWTWTNSRYRVGLKVIDGSGWSIRANSDTLRRYLFSNGNNHSRLQKYK